MKKAYTLTYLALGAFCLCFFVWLSFGSALRESATMDEPTHLTSGYVYWKTGHYTLNIENPPLVHLILAVPLLFRHLNFPSHPPPWVLTSAYSFPAYFLYHNVIPADSILNSSRFMGVLLGVALGCLVWRWANQLFGPRGAMFSLVAYSFCPPLLAYSALSTTDFGSAAFFVLAWYLYWRFRKQPSLQTAAASGIGMGLSIAAKFSAFLLIPLMLIALAFPETSLEGRKRLNRSFVTIMGVFIGSAALIVLALYKFTQIQTIFQGLATLRFVMSENAPHFLMGHFNDHGAWPWFLSTIFLIKTPVPFLAIVLLGLGLGFRSRDKKNREAFLWLVVPSALYIALQSFSALQFGIRRLLFIYPLLCIWVGGVVAEQWTLNRSWKFVCGLFGIWYMAATLFLFPRYFSYFNELVGGPSQGYRYALDCNLDWGQGLKELARYLDKEGIHAIYLCYYGAGDPHAYGLNYISIATKSPSNLLGNPEIDLRREKRALFAISATNLVGLSYKNHQLFDWLNQKHPEVVLLDSLWVYDLTHDPDAHKRIASMFHDNNDSKNEARENAWARTLRL